DSAEAHFYLGRALEELGETDAALRAYQGAVSLGHPDPEARYRLAKLERSLGLLGEAVRDMERAVEGEGSPWSMELAYLYLEAGQAEEAEVLGRRGVASEPDNPQRCLQVGILLHRLGKAEEALPWLEKAAANLDAAESHAALGAVYLSLQRWPEARKQYQAAARGVPKEEYQVKIAATLRLEGQLASAAGILEMVLEANPDSAEACYQRALVHREEKALPKAVELLRRAVALAPQEGEYRYTLAELLSLLGMRDEVESHLKALIEAPTLSPQLLVGVGRVYELQERWEEAMACYQRAAASRASAGCYHDIARVWQRLGRLEEAATALERAISLEGHHALWHSQLGQLREDLGEEDKALECYFRAADLEPLEARHHYCVGVLLERKGRYAASHIALEKAMRLQPDDTSIRAHLAAVTVKEALERGTLGYG
ncbi:MAG: tetratricopeptide repeat protein, partial [Chloroflexi bacterium]|nr:tetratricopeptide repeat protein [Chloroflexota bacterium]